jgi:hypothetical protein
LVNADRTERQALARMDAEERIAEAAKATAHKNGETPPSV